MGKKHHLSHLVSDLSTSTNKNAPAPAALKGAVTPTAATQKQSAPVTKPNYRRQQNDISSSDDDEDNVNSTAHTTHSIGASASNGYVATPKQPQQSSPKGISNANQPLATKRQRDETDALHASKEAQKKKSAVVETVTISGRGNNPHLSKKVVSQAPTAVATSNNSEDDEDDYDDNISIDSFDAEQMNAPQSSGIKLQSKKSAISSLNKADDNGDGDAFDDEEGDEEESEWDEEDIEALLAMGGESDEEFEEGLEMEEDDMSDMPSDDEEDDEDDDEYNEVAKELAKSKNTSSSAKNANPNKKDESVVVNFDAFGFEATDVDQTIHLLDNFIPDTMNQVDRDELSEVLMNEPTTMIIKQGERDSDDEDDDDDDDSEEGDDSDDEGDKEDAPPLNDDADDVFAIYSLLPISASLTSNAGKMNVSKQNNKTQAVAKALSGVLKTPWATLQRAPTTVSQLLVSNENNTSTQSAPPVLLLLMDHIKTVPIDVTLAAIDNIVSDAEGGSSPTEARYSNKQLANAKIICLAKIQRNAEKDNDRTTSKNLAKLKPPGAPGANNNKKRNAQISSSKVEVAGDTDAADESCPLDFMEAAVNAAEADKRSKDERKKERIATAAENNGFQLSDYVFWRPFEESLYDRRDPTVAVVAYKCRAQYDEQPDNDRPVSLAFAVTWNGLKQALTAVRNLAIPNTLEF